MNIENEIRSRLLKFKKIGTEKQVNGTELIGKAPHIAPLAWLHTIYRGLNNKELSTLEGNLKTEIPKDYKKFLQFSNGLNIFNTTFSLYGLRKSYNRKNEIANRLPFSILTTNQIERPFNSKNEYFYIGGYDWDGSHLYINKSDNKVYRCESKNANPINEWNNLNEMILSEIDRLIAIHNENGTEIDKNEPKTP